MQLNHLIRRCCVEVSANTFSFRLVVSQGLQTLQSNLDYPDFFSGPNLLMNIY